MSETRSPRRWAWIAATAVAIKACLYVAAFLWVAIYSHLLAPGQSVEAYRSYAQVASPIVAIVVGLPLFFLAARRLTAKLGASGPGPAVAMWGINVLLDVGVLAAVPLSGSAVLICLFSNLGYLVSSWAGASRARMGDEATA